MEKLTLIPTHDPCVLFDKWSLHVDCNPDGSCDCGCGSCRDREYTTSFRCPLKEVSCPRPELSACACLAERAHRELKAFGYDTEAESMRSDLSTSEVSEFGMRLEHVAEAIEDRYAGVREKPKGAAVAGQWEERVSTFHEAVEAIRDVGRWYQRVGQYGSGVQAVMI